MNNAYLTSLCGALLLLTGCSNEQPSINSFIHQIELESQREIEQLQPEKPYTPVAYRASEQREPFVLPKVALVAKQPRVKRNCWQPSARDKNGRLERFPLSDLRLRGVMGRNKDISGLIQTPQGTVVKVKPGEYIGLNNGRVVRVASNFLLIKETLPDGLGCWQQRSVKLALN
jgi:type IV pilus assembly protein PilP